MLGVSEAEAAAIRTAFDQGGELSAAVELRRLSGITGMADARARTILGWQPLPDTPRQSVAVKRSERKRPSG